MQHGHGASADSSGDRTGKAKAQQHATVYQQSRKAKVIPTGAGTGAYAAFCSDTKTDLTQHQVATLLTAQ
jgi:hypothetical protein